MPSNAETGDPCFKVTIEITMHRRITDEDGEAAMHAAISSLYDGCDEDHRDDRDDWGYDVSPSGSTEVKYDR